jgi:hypothetical protein
VTDIVSDIHAFDLGAFASPEEALAALACLADDSAEEIERLRYLLQEQLACQEGELKAQQQMVREAAQALNDEEREIERLRGLLREALSLQIYSHVVPHYQSWEQRVREALGDE